MVEIIAGVYLTSLVLSVVLTLTTLAFMRRRLRSPRAETINANLVTVGLFWSQAQSDFAAFSPEAFEHDQKKTLRDYAIVGLILSFLSAPGFLFLCLFTFSMHILARPRLEKAIFASRLAKEKGLTATEVSDSITEVKQRAGYFVRG